MTNDEICQILIIISDVEIKSLKARRNEANNYPYNKELSIECSLLSAQIKGIEDGVNVVKKELRR